MGYPVLSIGHTAGIIASLRHRRSKVIFYSILLLCVSLLHGSTFWLLHKRNFDQDEFYHLHAAWCVSKGLLPYRDFFEHHTPLYYFIIAPFLRLFSVETRVSDAIASLFWMRTLMWCLSALVIVFTFWLGKSWRNARVGSIGAFFLLATDAYWNISVEIRPDPLAVAFLLLYLIMIVGAIEPHEEDHRRRKRFALGGMFLALGFLTLQKLVYVLPGLAIANAWYVFSSSEPGSKRARFGDVAYQLLGFVTPIVLMGIYFYLRGGVTQLIQYTLFFNIGLRGFSPYPGIHGLLYQNPYLGIFGLAGLVSVTYLIFRGCARRRADIFIASCTISLVGGLLIIPVPYAQYYLFFLPLIALFAAALLIDSVTLLTRLRQRSSAWHWLSVTAVISFVILAMLLWIAEDVKSPWPHLIIPAYWLAAILGLIGLLFFRLPVPALTGFLIALSAPPLVRLHGDARVADTMQQIEQITYVIQHTLPTESVMDGYMGVGVFRPHAQFFWAFPYNVRQRLSENDKQTIGRALRTGAANPKLILFDHNLQDLSPDITVWFEQNYQPVGKGDIWRRKEKT